MKSRSLLDSLAILFCLAFTLAGIVVSLNRFWQYEILYYDFGIFDQAIWNVSRLQPPIIDHFEVGGKWIFADHFSPGIFLLTPLYWLTDRQEIILIAQAIDVGLSAFVLYLIGKTVLKNELLAFAITISYGLFIGLQNAIISDFHEVTVMILPLTLTFYAIVKRNTFWYFTCLLITLAFKESTFLLGIGISVALLFISKKSWRKIAALTFVISVAWGLASIYLIIPYFSGDSYEYFPSLTHGSSGFVENFFNNEVKRKTLLFTFASFSFLPAISPPFWLLILQDFVVRFIPENTFNRWGLGLHYSAQLSPILALATIFALKSLTRLKYSSKFLPILAALMILNAVILYRFVLHGPFGLAYNPAFYKHTENFHFLDDIVKKVPKDASVMTQNNVAAHFTHQKLYLLRNNYQDFNPEYILIDARRGQSINNFFGVKNFDPSPIIVQLRQDLQYALLYKTNEQFLFKRVR